MASFLRDIIDRFSTYDPAQRALPEPYEPYLGTGGVPVMDPGAPLEAMWTRADIETFWGRQPQLRKVVSFIARNLASIPLNVYERHSETDRKRVRDGDLAELMATPRPRVGPYRFWEAVYSDGLLYDRWAVQVEAAADGTFALLHLPSWRLRLVTDDLRRVREVWYFRGDVGRLGSDREQWTELDLDSLILDHGYAPRTAGLSPVATLRSLLTEADEAVGYRRQLWKNGPRIPGFISRPAGVSWDEKKRDRFVEQMKTYRRENAGGLPLLEDGMQIVDRKIFTPADAGDLEGRKLSAIEVASAFQIAPELVGAREGNYSNIDAFRQMLYRDSLGPYIKSMEDTLNAQLVPLMQDPRALYVEANLDVKLRGSFEEQARVKSAAVGAPWMTRNEARAMENRAPVDGGDDLVTPLNVLVGGQASPVDSGSQNEGPKASKAASALVKQTRRAQRDLHEQKYRQVLGGFFARQRRSVASKLGSKTPDWWDAERWDVELAEAMLALSLATSEQVARSVLEAYGRDAEVYDPNRTIAYLKAVAEASAGSINTKTLEALEKALADDVADPVGEVFGDGARIDALAVAAVTTAIGFGTHEAAQQGGATSKTWVTGANPRPEHAAMNGQTVPLDENFSNGLAWPGDAAGGVDDLAGCNCDLAIGF